MAMFSLPPSKMKNELIEIIQAQLVPFLQSSPGFGKSSLYAQIAKSFKLLPIDLRLSQCTPEDLMGLPMRRDGKAIFAPFAMFPLEGDAIPEGYNGWLLILDEFNSASKAVEAAAYKVALDRMVGQEKLHDACFVVAAGNLATDRAIVNQMSTAMQSRVIHLELEISHKDFMEHALQNDFDHRVLAFLEFQPAKLCTFKPDHSDKTFACPRTWEFASRLIKDKSSDRVSLPTLAGTLSEGVAVEFNAFLQEYGDLPSFDSIVTSPESSALPPKASTRYAVVGLLLSKFNKKNFESVVKYMKRMPTEFQVIFFRGVVQRMPSMRKEAIYRDNLAHLTEFLHGTEAA